MIGTFQALILYGHEACVYILDMIRAYDLFEL